MGLVVFISQNPQNSRWSTKTLVSSLLIYLFVTHLHCKHMALNYSYWVKEIHCCQVSCLLA